MTYDELVVEVEFVLNSRPLAYLSVEEPVTPSRHICGHTVLSLLGIEISDLSDPDHDLDQDEIFQRTQIVLSKFWEYLLRSRCITRGSKADIEVGAVVTDSQACGLVETLITKADGITRGARVQVISKTGRPITLRHPIQLVYPLEVRVHGPLETR